MDNLKIYQICHNLKNYFVTLISPQKVNYVLYLGSERMYRKMPKKNLEIVQSQLNLFPIEAI